MSSNPAIIVNNINKVFPMYNKPSDKLKELMSFGKKQLHQQFQALHDISFEIPKGKTMGIIGKNGSGKSTLLQIIAGTLAPTSGQVVTNGKVAAILELGAGFNPEFTGRENAYLNGAILGLGKEEMDEKFADIESFADIGHFIDMPVKTYSSGMFVRLAFSVAINVDPDILIVDEALAVGDIFFTHKCKNKMREIVDSGKTVLFVSHDILTIKSFCEEAILLDSGKIVMRGAGDVVADAYQKLMHEENYQKNNETKGDVVSKDSKEQSSTLEVNLSKITASTDWFTTTELTSLSHSRFGDGAARFSGIKMSDPVGAESSLFQYGETMVVSASIVCNQDINHKLEYGLLVRDINGIDIFGYNSFLERKELGPCKKNDRIIVNLSFPIKLSPGSYSIALGLKESFPSPHYHDKVFAAAVFEVAQLPVGTWVPGMISMEGSLTHKLMLEEVKAHG
ncbi:ABC transporter ATP-binding protein [Paenibacillus assamensis]|uniref:ABC transporter ATP-binding protein n=1 Tax=Paenibacillus assamensis TaxID=311244 RepID=UPI0003FD0AD2|nr:ABC transporter ATP-binding protein [Paenibacillus assamensis]